MVKYFIDTEFIEKPNTIQLISIGIVCEDGREYYAVSSEYNYYDASNWVKENVIEKIYDKTIYDFMKDGDTQCRTHEIWGQNYRDVCKITHSLGLQTSFLYLDDFHKRFGKSINQIKHELIEFITFKPEFWGYYADYDWVVFCWIFGTMMELPEHFPKYCRDLKQLADEYPEIPKMPESKDEHNALTDARWNRQFYLYLTAMIEGKSLMSSVLQSAINKCTKKDEWDLINEVTEDRKKADHQKLISEISTWKFLASGLTQEHQLNVKSEIEAHIESLENQLKNIK